MLEFFMFTLTELTYMLHYCVLCVAHTFTMVPDIVDRRLQSPCPLSACLTEPVDRENNPDPLPSPPWDLPLGGGGKERSGENLRYHFFIISYCTYGPLRDVC